MKKVKFILTAITVFAVVGGALAFKAKGIYKFYCANSPELACDVEQIYLSTYDPRINADKIFNCADAPTTEPCPAVSLMITQ